MVVCELLPSSHTFCGLEGLSDFSRWLRDSRVARKELVLRAEVSAFLRATEREPGLNSAAVLCCGALAVLCLSLPYL